MAQPARREDESRSLSPPSTHRHTSLTKFSTSLLTSLACHLRAGKSSGKLESTRTCLTSAASCLLTLSIWHSQGRNWLKSTATQTWARSLMCSCLLLPICTLVIKITCLITPTSKLRRQRHHHRKARPRRTTCSSSGGTKGDSVLTVGRLLGNHEGKRILCKIWWHLRDDGITWLCIAYIVCLATQNRDARYAASFIYVGGMYFSNPLISTRTSNTIGRTPEKRAVSVAMVSQVPRTKCV